ncbi:putative Zinc finger, C3HC [Helianthus annuus]|uniref:Putative C3HC zinc finger-like protein n=1 Tax=Helianthus annuus TaxID=4232 RepID=A0A251U0E1_HELAN|nr:nuclear-interacting partner of ALK [Helianthus annuus]KAF5792595.1 putative Zinc finger, C3HC [Helianthus annuus]KAJ0527526.1 putative Zinc finger, C3HC [Helianthus annuus]KAJ0543933.1 putative Zinc finger, C3HC [Helianthus annuus]KAJ0708989.1 putative Zinc finger, C3HC [Helianthus annuus]KAJ0894849.1 putative Zinc finger, C3HC [Helianthus annuus]
MAEESEKRFHAVMDKLFLPSPPNSKPPSSSSRKRPYTMTTKLDLVDLKSKRSMAEELKIASGRAVDPPVCRPWDREDLLKRLATFKSMTWFAKPEVVSAVNCARRGWINVDTDTIACESCGARLFFSTPSSWAQEQVEKAASVFSLKLNSGHKLLCPWVDNACDEKLAQFPPASPVDLVDNYKNRCASLLQLSELPVISSSVVDYMSTPVLEHFLKCPPTLDESEQVSPILYYQAQKLISLCGWEPRLLPYIVDCNDAPNAGITVYSSRTSENVEENEGFVNDSEKYDHTSVILECRFCGARVGLWAFKMTQRPTEFVRLIGHAEPSDHHVLETSRVEKGEQTASSGNGNSSVTSSNKNVLSLTIAGGPPPAEQNFRPTISFPVVGQNLRTRFSSAFGVVNGGQHSSTTNRLVEATGDSAMKSAVSDQPENVDGKEIKFDPIKQHRYFCPWVSSNGKLTPGWKQTLSALERQKEFVYSSETTEASSSLIEVEDPVGSVKKLLTPPSAKRKKIFHGSS